MATGTQAGPSPAHCLLEYNCLIHQKMDNWFICRAFALAYSGHQPLSPVTSGIYEEHKSTWGQSLPRSLQPDPCIVSLGALESHCWETGGESGHYVEDEQGMQILLTTRDGK